MIRGRRRLWSVEDTAGRLGLTVAEVEEFLAAGELPHLAVGERRFVPAAAVLGLVDEAMAGWDPSRYRSVSLPASVGPLADLYELLEAAHALLSVSSGCPDLPTIGVATEFAAYRQRLEQLVADLQSRYAEQVGV